MVSHPGSMKNKFTVIAPYCSDQEKWCQLSWVNIHDGTIFRLGRPGLSLPYEVKAKTCGDVLCDYHKHPEGPMHIGKTLFAQLMDFLPWTTFGRIVERYGDDRYDSLHRG
jgi:hypothetical protein